MSFIATAEPRPQPPTLTVGERSMAFGDRAYVMGVVNVTPDSFFDGGDYWKTDAAVDRALQLQAAGADIIDVGGESTRPGADPVSVDDELHRVIPVIEALRRHSDVWISVDTYKSEVAAAAINAGADIVNDISGLGFDDQMAHVVADAGCGLVVMHIRRTPKTMQQQIRYDDLLGEIRAYFEHRVQRALDAGVKPSRIVLDPGIGFGKRVHHNYQLLRDLGRFTDLGHPLLVGTSRKSFIGSVLDAPPRDRQWGTAATVACALFAGADIVRVHDVEAMTEVTRVCEAICAMAGPGANR